ncbi:MAG: HlyD family efflux transporter periplasmic adaptor subunit [Bacteroidales bacterium]|nr:HlyD family efflux transporter periplasmic adaptor subunit [Bacteroidales bacterium]MCF8351688.1 HlyD family efflux transporter periplasmic adaptor subunit [Bacteroidales bacterium]MCF8376233.1 HlyD family efflux transporter periplasmic adaptor subunit [Bacteroidales bacterium]MCF8401210.1 HlyD family efflux transporter periplasmic adaptor subunit [Bacteroidales bacterium]
MNRKIIIVVAVLFILVISAGLAYFFLSLKKDPPSRPTANLVRAVNVMPVVYEDITAVVEATGRLGSQHYVDVIAEVQGEILQGEVSLKRGQNFREGELLFSIYDGEMAFTLKASKSRFLNQLANALPDLNIDYPESYDKWYDFFKKIEIDEPLPELPAISSDQVKTFLAGRNILTDYYTIKSNEERFKKYQVHAPFKGSFAEVYLEVGSIANPGSRVARIIRTDRLELDIPVEVEDVKWIEVGGEADVYTEDGELHWIGKISRKADFVDPKTQSVSVFVSIYPSQENPLYEGQYLRAVFQGRQLKDVMEIPRNAVFNRNQVFIVKDSLLHQKTIDIHKVNQESIIFSGLEEGVDVVVEPLVNIPEKAKVKPLLYIQE